MSRDVLPDEIVVVQAFSRTFSVFSLSTSEWYQIMYALLVTVPIFSRVPWLSLYTFPQVLSFFGHPVLFYVCWREVGVKIC